MKQRIIYWRELLQSSNVLEAYMLFIRWFAYTEKLNFEHNGLKMHVLENQIK